MFVEMHLLAGSGQTGCDCYLGNKLRLEKECVFQNMFV